MIGNGVLSIEKYLKDKFDYSFNGNLDEFYNKDFIEFEVNGVKALFWIKEGNDRYLLNENRENLIDNLFLIKNNKDLYCILLTGADKYYWSLYKDKVFEPFRCVDDKKDIVIDNLMDFTSCEKVQSVYPDISNLPLNKRVKKLSKCGINTKGYHFE